MKKILLFFLCILNSCAVGFYPIKGQYLDRPYEIKSKKDFETTWSSVIDMFAQKGLSIKVIDKSSGLIVSERTSFKGHCAFENKNGRLDAPDAWIVVAKPKGAAIHPEDVTGEWNIRVKKDENNSSTINVNLTNIQAYSQVATTIYKTSNKISYAAKSTGAFEKLIADNVK